VRLAAKGLAVEALPSVALLIDAFAAANDFGAGVLPVRARDSLCCFSRHHTPCLAPTIVLGRFGSFTLPMKRPLCPSFAEPAFCFDKKLYLP
jgi:hypothetical protein